MKDMNTPEMIKKVDFAEYEGKYDESVNDELKELFSKYTDCVQKFQTISECLLFQNSFRLGAKIMLEVMEE